MQMNIVHTSHLYLSDEIMLVLWYNITTTTTIYTVLILWTLVLDFKTFNFHFHQSVDLLFHELQYKLLHFSGSVPRTKPSALENMGTQYFPRIAKLFLRIQRFAYVNNLSNVVSSTASINSLHLMVLVGQYPSFTLTLTLATSFAPLKTSSSAKHPPPHLPSSYGVLMFVMWNNIADADPRRRDQGETDVSALLPSPPLLLHSPPWRHKIWTRQFIGNNASAGRREVAWRLDSRSSDVFKGPIQIPGASLQVPQQRRGWSKFFPWLVFVLLNKKKEKELSSHPMIWFLSNSVHFRSCTQPWMQKWKT